MRTDERVRGELSLLKLSRARRKTIVNVEALRVFMLTCGRPLSRLDKADASIALCSLLQVDFVDLRHDSAMSESELSPLRLLLHRLGKKIEARPTWKPMHKQPVYQGAPVYTNGIEENLFKVGFCLPAGPYVSDEDVKYIVECIKDAIN